MQINKGEPRFHLQRSSDEASVPPSNRHLRLAVGNTQIVRVVMFKTSRDLSCSLQQFSKIRNIDFSKRNYFVRQSRKYVEDLLNHLEA